MHLRFFLVLEPTNIPCGAGGIPLLIWLEGPLFGWKDAWTMSKAREWQPFGEGKFTLCSIGRMERGRRKVYNGMERRKDEY